MALGKFYDSHGEPLYRFCDYFSFLLKDETADNDFELKTNYTDPLEYKMENEGGRLKLDFELEKQYRELFNFSTPSEIISFLDHHFDKYSSLNPGKESQFLNIYQSGDPKMRLFHLGY